MPRGRIAQEEPPPQEYPILHPIHGGKWAAHGNGWAVHGDTPEEARENYWKTLKRREEILELPPWYIQKQIRDEKVPR